MYAGHSAIVAPVTTLWALTSNNLRISASTIFFIICLGENTEHTAYTQLGSLIIPVTSWVPVIPRVKHWLLIKPKPDLVLLRPRWVLIFLRRITGVCLTLFFFFEGPLPYGVKLYGPIDAFGFWWDNNFFAAYAPAAYLATLYGIIYGDVALTWLRV